MTTPLRVLYDVQMTGSELTMTFLLEETSHVDQ